MKIILAFSIIAQSLLAQEAPKSVVPAPSIAPALSTAMEGNKSMMVIDPKARAEDYIQAFDLMRKDRPILKIAVRTTSTLLTNVTEISATSGGTLLLVKVLSNQGSRMQIVPLEEMMELSYSP